MRKCLNVKMNKSFTILEVIITIFIITIGVLAAYTVTQQIISYTYRSVSRLTATYLAMEGIEIVRNIRDTNWLEEEDWVNGLSSTDWLSHPQLPKYERKITIEETIDSDGNDILKVSVEVQWKYKGDTYGPITVQEILYKWYPD